ncbi:MAG: deoxyribodipyrimidine photo-lyase [Actinomycetota bacterium]|nr:deoxyribodipyrimidine photo-lyase [Actinomycetota bacterium]
MTLLFWFRRDLRVQDNEALSAAVSRAQSDKQPLAAGFVFGEDFQNLSPIRRNSLITSVKSLSDSLPEGLIFRSGNVAASLLSICKDLDVSVVYATRSFDTHGMLEQSAVAELLYGAGISLQLVGSNYAVQPGTVRKDDESTLRVYTPFYKRWVQFIGQRPIEVKTESVSWVAGSGELPELSQDCTMKIQASEAYALDTWRRFQKRALRDYSENRNRTDLSGTSHLSHALAHGEIHPRTLLAELGDSPGEEVFRKELAWREFYADVLFHNPHTYDGYYEPRFEKMRYDSAENNSKLEAWKTGNTGYPIVDAAMRQLLTTGWMHNRSRMIVASFLVKDLHIEWQIGARWFEKWLTDFDPASNSHGWQWTAGCGTDASPYYRVFNPTLQGYKFDPNGDYVRKYIPELRHIAGAEVHEPWKLIDGLQNGYPAPILDHSLERDESLARLEEIKG